MDLDLEPHGPQTSAVTENIEEKDASPSVMEVPIRERLKEFEVERGYVAEKDLDSHYDEVPIGGGIISNDDDEYIDPRLKDYPILLVAKTVDLRNDPTIFTKAHLQQPQVLAMDVFIVSDDEVVEETLDYTDDDNDEEMEEGELGDTESDDDSVIILSDKQIEVISITSSLSPDPISARTRSHLTIPPTIREASDSPELPISAHTRSLGQQQQKPCVVSHVGFQTQAPPALVGNSQRSNRSRRVQATGKSRTIGGKSIRTEAIKAQRKIAKRARKKARKQARVEKRKAVVTSTAIATPSVLPMTTVSTSCIPSMIAPSSMPAAVSRPFLETNPFVMPGNVRTGTPAGDPIARIVRMYPPDRMKPAIAAASHARHYNVATPPEWLVRPAGSRRRMEKDGLNWLENFNPRLDTRHRLYRPDIRALPRYFPPLNYYTIYRHGKIPKDSDEFFAMYFDPEHPGDRTVWTRYREIEEEIWFRRLDRNPGFSQWAKYSIGYAAGGLDEKERLEVLEREWNTLQQILH